MMKTVFKRKISFQVGVDILGFPIYVTHEIYQDNPKINRAKKGWITVIQTIFKQH